MGVRKEKRWYKEGGARGMKRDFVGDRRRGRKGDTP